MDEQAIRDSFLVKITAHITGGINFQVGRDMPLSAANALVKGTTLSGVRRYHGTFANFSWYPPNRIEYLMVEPVGPAEDVEEIDDEAPEEDTE